MNEKDQEAIDKFAPIFEAGLSFRELMAIVYLASLHTGFSNLRWMIDGLEKHPDKLT